MGTLCFFPRGGKAASALTMQEQFEASLRLETMKRNKTIASEFTTALLTGSTEDLKEWHKHLLQEQNRIFAEIIKRQREGS